MATRNELILAITDRYQRATPVEKGRILDEFVAVSGYHRKHAMRVLRGGPPSQRSGSRPGRRVYDDAVREARVVLWEAADRVGGKRLRPLLPTLVTARERHGHLHLEPSARGSFVQTLVVTDIATGWTECAPLLVREQTLLTEVLGTIREVLPFPLRGFDTDHDTVFLTETGLASCRTTAITFPRCRPYRKNDPAWVEQQNGAVVRRRVGYRRFAGVAAAAALARLYASVRLFVHFFQPSFQLAEQTRDGAKITKRNHAPAAPGQRLLADPRTPAVVRQRWRRCRRRSIRCACCARSVRCRSSSWRSMRPPTSLKIWCR